METCVKEDVIQSNLKGLSSQEVEESRTKYGPNIFTPPKRDPLWKMFLEKFEDPIIRILMIAAALAIIVGVFEGKYYEGVGIIAAILLATVLAFWNELKALKQFDLLAKSSDDKECQVLRDGIWKKVARKEVVVGEIVKLETGCEAPADGMVLKAVSLQINQAAFTGESMPVVKMTEEDARKEGVNDSQYPPHIVYGGTIVSEGSGEIRIDKVGDKTEFGKLVHETLEGAENQTPLTMQLEKLSKWIGVVGFGVAGLVFIALVLKGVLSHEFILSSDQWLFSGLVGIAILVALTKVWLPIVYDALELTGKEFNRPKWLEDEEDQEEGDDSNAVKNQKKPNSSMIGWFVTIGGGVALAAISVAVLIAAKIVPVEPQLWMPRKIVFELLEYFMIAVTIIVVAVPEGLAMSVVLSLAYSMRKMLQANLLVKEMHACETIGATSVICSDKTGTLTTNEMRTQDVIVPCFNAPCAKEEFGCNYKDSCKTIFYESIAANSTAELSKDGGVIKPIGNITEGALLLWLESQGINYEQYRNSFEIEKQMPFDTKRKFMATLGFSKRQATKILYIKGAPEIILEKCTSIMAANGPVPITKEDKNTIHKSLLAYQEQGYRTLGFGYKQCSESETDILASSDNCTWLRFVAIEDPVRPDVPQAIKDCHAAGIEVKMVTGDHPETAQQIARQIGLLGKENSKKQHITGNEFESMSDDEALMFIPSLKVLSRARPEHKLKLVNLLRKNGHVVAVTGDGVNDLPALSNSDVGLAMGKTGQEAAKKVAKIVIKDDSFKTIKTAVLWGRTLYENIQRFILFQLTVNVAALGIALIGPFIGIKLPLTVIQMLWINLIMDTFAALALATEPPNANVLKRPPRSPGAFIVTSQMFKDILGYGSVFVVFLVSFLLYIQKDGVVTPYELSTFFATFVMLQFWNLFNARCLGLSHSALLGFWKNKSFLTIAIGVFAGTFAMVQYGGDVFRTVPLSVSTWTMIICGSSMVLWVGEILRLFDRQKSMVGNDVAELESKLQPSIE